MDKAHLEHHLTLMDKVEHRGIASWRETEAEREEQHTCLTPAGQWMICGNSLQYTLLHLHVQKFWQLKNTLANC